MIGLDTPYFVRHRWRPWKDKQGHYHCDHEVSYMRDPDEQAKEPTTMPNDAGAKLIALLEKYNSSGPANGAEFDVFCIFHEDAPMIVAKLLATLPNAADAVGAVGVSREEAKALLKDIDMARFCRDYGWEQRATKRVVALLTNQHPASPTSDGATGGETV